MNLRRTLHEALKVGQDSVTVSVEDLARLMAANQVMDEHLANWMGKLSKPERDRISSEVFDGFERPYVPAHTFIVERVDASRGLAIAARYHEIIRDNLNNQADVSGSAGQRALAARHHDYAQDMHRMRRGEMPVECSDEISEVLKPTSPVFQER